MEAIQTETSLAQFVNETAQKEQNKGVFELESNSMLEINLKGRVWTKIGAMVAYRGNIKFEREGAFEGGLGKFIKKAVTGEAAILTAATGEGKLYVADHHKYITILRLNNESVNVQGNDVLAFEDTIKSDIKMIKSVAGMLSGGLFCVRLEGTGMVAITSHGHPMTLKCSPASPVFTDPNATIAWAGNISPKIKIDASLKTLLGKGSGETFQMEFNEEGFVVIQPYEETYAAASA